MQLQSVDFVYRRVFVQRTGIKEDRYSVCLCMCAVYRDVQCNADIGGGGERRDGRHRHVDAE